MEHVLDCASTDGALYTVCGSFVINTAYGLSSVVGDRNSWTLEELLAAYETLEPGASLFNGYVAIDMVLAEIRLVVRQRLRPRTPGLTGEEAVHINHRGIPQQHPPLPEGRAAAGGKIRLPGQTGAQLQQSLELLRIKGAGSAYVGFPTQGGAGSSFTLCDTLSMSAACRHKEGAWAYIRQSWGSVGASAMTTMAALI